MTTYDYTFQCYVKDGIVQRCGHREDYPCTCNGRIYEGMHLAHLYHIKSTERLHQLQFDSIGE